MLRFVALFTILTVLCGFSTAHAVPFSPYACEFVKIGDEDWQLFSGSLAEYKTELNWNSQADIINFNWRFASGAEFGACAQVDSTSPDKLRLLVSFITGKDLSSALVGCAYNGTAVQYTTVKTSIISNDAYTWATLDNVIVDGKPYRDMIVAGVKPEPVTMDDFPVLCQKDFQAIMASAPLKTNAQFKSRIRVR